MAWSRGLARALVRNTSLPRPPRQQPSQQPPLPWQPALATHRSRAADARRARPPRARGAHPGDRRAAGSWEGL